MTRITLLDGTELDLKNSDIRWESVNTLFEEEAFQSDYSFPFTLPPTAPNKKALNFAHKADVPTVQIKWDIILFSGDRSIRSVLVLNGWNDAGYSVSVAGGINGLINAESKLRALPFIADTTDGLPDGQILLGSYPWGYSRFFTADWRNIIAFPPHYNPGFYGGNNADFCGVINRVDSDTNTLLTNTLGTGSKYCWVPFLYMHYILKTIFDENGLVPVGSGWSDDELSKALLYNSYAMDARQEQGSLVKANGNQVMYFHQTGYATQKQFVTLAANLLDGCYDPSGCWQLWAGAGPVAGMNNYVYDIPANGDYSVHHKGVIGFAAYPFLHQLTYKMYYWDGSTLTALCVVYYGNNPFGGAQPGQAAWTEFDMMAVIPGAVAGGKVFAMGTVGLPDVTLGYDYTCNYQLVGGSELIIARYDVADFNIMDGLVKLKNHLPDLTVSAFLKAYKNWAKMQFNINWDDKTVSMDFAETTLTKTEPVDLTALADPKYILVFDEKGAGFKLSYAFGSTDTLLTDNFKSFDINKLLGEYNTTDDLPSPSLVGYYAIVKNKNKVMKEEVVSSVLTWVEYSDNYYTIIYNNKGNKGKVYEIELAPMMMTDLQENEASTANARKCLMPAINEVGNSILFETGVDNTPSLRVVFMRGVIAAGTYGGEYVYASSTNIDINGVQMGNYILRMDGLDGWYKRFLEKLMLAIDNSAVFEFYISLPTSYLQYKGKVQISNVNYLVKNISMMLGKGIKQSVVKLLKL